MTRDEIIKWAKDCLLLDFRDNPATDTAVAQFVGTLEDFAALVAAAEREACAKVCEKISDEYDENEGRKYAELRTDAATGGRDCASAIRARGEKGQS